MESLDWQAWLTAALAVSALVMLTITRAAPHLIMMAVLAVLSVTGILTAEQALAGFSNSGLITVAAMFVVAAGLHASGAIDWLVHYVLGRPETLHAAMLRIGAPVALASAFVNNTPVVATMIPAVRIWARHRGFNVSRLMIPLSYAAILGGTLTLLGTSTNLMINGQYQAITGQAGFELFSITRIGVPAVLAGGLFMLWWCPRVLPTHSDDTPFGNMREFTLEVAVAHDGPLVGKTIERAGLRHLRKVFLVEIERDGDLLTAVSSEEALKGGDRLVFAGQTAAISDLLRINGIVASTPDRTPLLAQNRPGRRLVEAVISPHSDCIGETIRDSRFRKRYGAVVLAVARHGERVSGNLGSIRLRPGDSLLLEAPPDFVGRQQYNKDFLLVNDTDTEAPRHQRALAAWAILAGVVLGAALGWVSLLNAALIGAALMIVSGCCTVQQAQRGLDLPVLITIAASFALATALLETGLAALAGRALIGLGAGHPWGVLALSYLAVSLLTNLITNNATGILMLPIGLEVAGGTGLPAEAMVFTVMMAASASFATPLGYQTNLMVYGPGGYTFADFLKAGIPMNIVVGITSVTALGLFYL